MESEIRTLLGKYGYQAVREFLDNEMLNTYQYLNTYFKNNKHKNTQKNPENVVVNPVPQEVVLTSEIPQQPLHIEKDVSGDVTEKTVSIGNTATNSSKARKTKQMALTKEPAPEPVPLAPEATPETKSKKKYYYKKKK